MNGRGKRSERTRHFGGIRTFTLLGGLGGIAGGFAAAGWMPIATAVLSGALALVAIGYAGRVRQDIDATTEVAAVVVLAAGAAAGGGQLALASAIVSVTAIVLLEKTRLHALVGRVDDRRAACERAFRGPRPGGAAAIAGRWSTDRLVR